MAPAIQQRARELGLIREEQMSGSKKIYAKKLAAALIIAIAFAVLVFFANGARSFADGFGYSYLIWTVVKTLWSSTAFGSVMTDVSVFPAQKT